MVCAGLVRRLDLFRRRRERRREFSLPRRNGLDDGQRRADLGSPAAPDHVASATGAIQVNTTAPTVRLARPTHTHSTSRDARRESARRNWPAVVSNATELAGDQIVARVVRAATDHRHRRAEGRYAFRLVCRRPRAPRICYKLYAESFRVRASGAIETKRNVLSAVRGRQERDLKARPKIFA